MKIFQVIFKFLDPSQAVGTIMAETPEDAVEKIKADIAENSPEIQDIEIVSVEEVLEHPNLQDMSPDRSLQ